MPAITVFQPYEYVWFVDSDDFIQPRLSEPQTTSPYHYSVPPRPCTTESPNARNLPLVTEVRWLNAFLDHLGYLAGLRYASPMGRVGADGKSGWSHLSDPGAARLPIAWSHQRGTVSAN